MVPRLILRSYMERVFLCYKEGITVENELLKIKDEALAKISRLLLL